MCKIHCVFSKMISERPTTFHETWFCSSNVTRATKLISLSTCKTNEWIQIGNRRVCGFFRSALIARHPTAAVMKRRKIIVLSPKHMFDVSIKSERISMTSVSNQPIRFIDTPLCIEFALTTHCTKAWKQMSFGDTSLTLQFLHSQRRITSSMSHIQLWTQLWFHELGRSAKCQLLTRFTLNCQHGRYRKTIFRRFEKKIEISFNSGIRIENCDSILTAPMGSARQRCVWVILLAFFIKPRFAVGKEHFAHQCRLFVYVQKMAAKHSLKTIGKLFQTQTAVGNKHTQPTKINN